MADDEDDQTIADFIDTAMNTEFFALPGLPSVGFESPDDEFTSLDNSRDPRQMCEFNDPDPDCLLKEFNSRNLLLKRDSWVLPMLALSALNVICILIFEVYVICKAARNSPSRRHLFLGKSKISMYG